MTHAHPKPFIDQLSQGVSLVGLAAIFLSVPAFVLIVLQGAPAGFLLAIPVILALGLPLVMRLSITPMVTVNDDGFTVQPRYGRAQTILWSQVERVEDFPLLPTEDAEVVRKRTVGTRNYTPAEGIMLIIPSLSWRYRVGGFFAGTGGKPIIAFTNRSHKDYDMLKKTVYQHVVQATL